jgi:hypothetical protein
MEVDFGHHRFQIHRLLDDGRVVGHFIRVDWFGKHEEQFVVGQLFTNVPQEYPELSERVLFLFVKFL